MQHTRRNFTISSVAGEDPGGALAWLERRTAWDDRLRALERQDPPVSRPRRMAVRLRAVADQPAAS